MVGQVDASELEVVLYVDCTKFGVVSQHEVNAIGTMCEKSLFRNPTRHVLRVKFECENAHWLGKLGYAYKHVPLR